MSDIDAPQSRAPNEAPAPGTSSDAHRFRERWNPVRSLDSGNQGLAYEAIDADGVRAFVKEFNASDRGHTERRQRFCREVRILTRLGIPGIPRLIESNAEHFLDPSYELYLAAEYVDGECFLGVVNENIEPTAALDLVLQVCAIVSAAHAKGVLHRDIKPENVMVVASKPVLTAHVVDFGMAHIEELPTDMRTRRGQEGGNRFLRLPEYASGSDNKLDPRSDITFCVGLLFFALTKTKPAWLLDHDNLLPHQRPRMREALAQTGLDLSRLLAVFDVGFANDIGERYQTFSAVIDDLRELRDAKPSEDADGAAAAQRLRQRYLTPTRIAQHQIEQAMRESVASIYTLLTEIINDCGGLLAPGMENFAAGADGSSCTYTVMDPADMFRRFTTYVEAKTVGGEHVFLATGEERNGFKTRYPVGTAMPENEAMRFRTFLEVGIDKATSDERFTTPRPIHGSPYHPFVGGENAPGWWLEEEEATFEYRPMLVIAWFRPHMRSGHPVIGWSVTNHGSGIAVDVRFSLPYLAHEAVPEIAIGQNVFFEHRFDQRAAYHDTLKGRVAGFTEFIDRDAHLYRQSAEVHSRPARFGWEADYYTTQFGYPFLTKANQRMIEVPAKGSDIGHRTHSYRDLVSGA